MAGIENLFSGKSSSLAALYAEYHCVLDRTLAKNGINLTCSKGCPACCEELLHVTEVEACYIIEGLTDEQKEELRGRVQEWLLQARKRNLAEREPSDAHEYRAWRMRCPLLVDGACSVYERRPFSCRTFMTTGPRRACEDLALRRKQTFLTTPELNQHMHERILLINGRGQSGDDLVLSFAHLGFYLAELLGIEDV